jgi:glyoxylase-like metal-dependent hydrolase (beta-lactamase superfamily II)
MLASTNLAYSPPEIDCVFLSHAHFDHITHIEFLDPAIPVCMGVGTKLFMESMEETGYFADYGQHPCNKFRTGHKVKIGDLTVELMHLFFVKCFYFLKLHHRKRSGMN